MTELDTLLSDSPPQAEPAHRNEPPPQRDLASAEKSTQDEIAEAEALLSETLGVPLLNEHQREQGQGLLSMEDAIARGLISPDLCGD